MERIPAGGQNWLSDGGVEFILIKRNVPLSKIPYLTFNEMWQKHLAVLKIVVEKLDAHGIKYQLTGGIAGNVFGSLWPPHDIDFDVCEADFAKIATLFHSNIKKPPYHYTDQEFDFRLMTLVIDGIEIDFTQIEDSFGVTTSGERFPFLTDLAKAERHNFMGMKVMVQPLQDIIEYKRKIGRFEDVEDLSNLR
jgi:hypothetical protein